MNSGKSWDVAISFLNRDEPVARKLYTRLTGYRVFFFPKAQEDLAGTDGLESLRHTFFEDNSLTVILYRDGWGQSPWTRVEETAIEDAALARGWDRLLFVNLDPKSTVPPWVPTTRIRLNYWEYGEDELIGVIKRQLSDVGIKETKKEDAAALAKRLAEAKRQEDERQRLLWTEGPSQALLLCKALYSRIEEKAAEVAATAGYQFEVRSDAVSCGVHADSGSIAIRWDAPYINSIRDTALVIEEYTHRLAKNGQPTVFFVSRVAKVKSTERYALDWQPSFGWCWADKKSRHLTTEMLADAVMQKALMGTTRPTRDEDAIPFPK